MATQSTRKDLEDSKFSCSKPDEQSAETGAKLKEVIYLQSLE